jgi:hypothetical protein
MPRPNRIPERVLLALRETGPSSPLELSKALGIEPVSYGTVRLALRRLERSGHVIQTGYGLYALSPRPPPARQSAVHYIENAAAAFLKQVGRPSRVSAICWALWGRRPRDLPTEYRLLLKVLNGGPLFERAARRRWMLSGQGAI